jgi:hypothetical protein
MSIMKEYPEEYGWWINELNSLGVKEGKRDYKSNKQQLKDLAENTKQYLYNEYKGLYSQQLCEKLLQGGSSVMHLNNYEPYLGSHS